MKLHRLWLWLIILWGVAVGCTRTHASPRVVKEEGILFRSLIYWVRRGERTQIVKPEVEDVYVIGWTPGGRYLWWLSQADNGPVIWLSDPCGQSPPKKVFDPADYPDLRFSAQVNTYGWLDDTHFLLTSTGTYPNYHYAIYQFDLQARTFDIWLPDAQLAGILSPHIVIVWDVPNQQYVFWAWGATFPAPSELTPYVFYQRSVQVSPDKRWLLWGDEDGWYVAPLDSKTGPRFEEARQVPIQGSFVGWMFEGPALVFYSTESLPNEQVRYIFQIIDPAEGVVTRTIAFASPLIRTLPPFVPGPYGRRVALDGVDLQDPDHSYAYIEVWDLLNGERQRIYETHRGVLTVWDWALVDVGACPRPPQAVR